MKTWTEHMSGNGIDSYSNYGGSLEHEHDFILLSRTRDSHLLENNNFENALLELEKVDNNNFYVLSFNHWACGWLEHIFIKKDTIAYNKAVEIENSLADYPLLNESNYYDKLYEQSQDFWEELSTQEKIEICKEHGQSIFSARADRIPDNCGIEEYCQSDI